MTEKAYFIALDENRKQKGPKIAVMFNPSEYDYALAMKYSGQETGRLQFNGAELQPLSITLFYDTYEQQTDVRQKYLNQITKLLLPTIEGTDTKRPAECIFAWGKFTITGVIQKIDQKFTMFLGDGTPVRATVTISIQPTLTDKELLELTGKEACRKLWQVKSGDRLDRVAHETLKDPAKWRKIAKANQINSPLDFPGIDDIGTVLVVPD
jgi:hypothetical protein